MQRKQRDYFCWWNKDENDERNKQGDTVFPEWTPDIDQIEAIYSYSQADKQKIQRKNESINGAIQ